MALSLSSQYSQPSSKAPLGIILLAVFLIILLFGIFYLLFQRGFFAKTNQGSSQIYQTPTIDFQEVILDQRFGRLKVLEPIPELEIQAGRDNPFSAYGPATAINQPKKAKIK